MQVAEGLAARTIWRASCGRCWNTFQRQRRRQTCRQLGDLDQAFAWLDKAYDERSHWLLYLNVEPKFDLLRPDPRFAALRRRLDFPT